MLHERFYPRLTRFLNVDFSRFRSRCEVRPSALWVLADWRAAIQPGPGSTRSLRGGRHDFLMLKALEANKKPRRVGREMRKTISIAIRQKLFSPWRKISIIKFPFRLSRQINSVIELSLASFFLFVPLSLWSGYKFSLLLSAFALPEAENFLMFLGSETSKIPSSNFIISLRKKRAANNAKLNLQKSREKSFRFVWFYGNSAALWMKAVNCEGNEMLGSIVYHAERFFLPFRMN